VRRDKFIKCKGKVYCRYCRYYTGGLTCDQYDVMDVDSWYNTGATHEYYSVANRDNDCPKFYQLNRLAFFLRSLIDEDY
jgi:hypothetical protein